MACEDGPFDEPLLKVPTVQQDEPSYPNPAVLRLIL